MKWKILDTGVNSAEKNMAIDYDLLRQLRSTSDPILRFYDWERNCATYGYFTKPEKFLDLEEAKKLGFSLARRPTGGGILFHTCDFTFSVLIPASHPAFTYNTMENYAFVNQRIADALRSYLGDQVNPLLLQEEVKSECEDCCHFCMAKPTKYDVMIDGRKVAGGAQRRTKEGYLHQGSIALTVTDTLLVSKLIKNGSDIHQAMKSNCFSLNETIDIKTIKKTLIAKIVDF